MASYHLKQVEWIRTQKGEPRGYIQPGALRELWFHTGTRCNLSCSFCLEGSKPGDDRLQAMTFEDVAPWIDGALAMGVEQFSFTGGEPFVVKDFIRILSRALDHRPCLVLTNGTRPLTGRMDEIRPLLARPHLLRFRISLDWPDPGRHDRERGPGGFEESLATAGALHRLGFKISIARQMERGEDRALVDAAYRLHLERAGLPPDTALVPFPDFLPPGSIADVPEITEDCMTRYQTAVTRETFMCSFSKMVVKKNGRLRVYACTLVDDDEDYDMGEDLARSQGYRIMLKHHRCYSCFALGASCSER